MTSCMAFVMLDVLNCVGDLDWYLALLSKPGDQNCVVGSCASFSMRA